MRSEAKPNFYEAWHKLSSLHYPTQNNQADWNPGWKVAIPSLTKIDILPPEPPLSRIRGMLWSWVLLKYPYLIFE